MFEILNNIEKQKWADLQLFAYLLVNSDPQVERFKNESNHLQKLKK